MLFTKKAYCNFFVKDSKLGWIDKSEERKSLYGIKDLSLYKPGIFHMEDLKSAFGIFLRLRLKFGSYVRSDNVLDSSEVNHIAVFGILNGDKSIERSEKAWNH